MANESTPPVDDLKKKKVSPSSMSNQSTTPTNESAKTTGRVSPENSENLGVAGSSREADEVGKASPSTKPKAGKLLAEAPNVKERISPKTSPREVDDLSPSASKNGVRTAAVAKAKKALAKKTKKDDANGGTEGSGSQQSVEAAASKVPSEKGTKKTSSWSGLGIIRSSDKVVSQVLPEDIPQETSVNRVRDPLTGEEIDVVVEPNVGSSEFAWLEAALIASGVAALVALVILLRSHTNLLVPVSAWARVKAANSDNPVFQTLLTVLAHLTGDVTGSVPSEACLIPIKTVDSSNFKVSKYMRGGRIAKAIKTSGVFRTPNQYIYRVASVKTYRHFIVIKTKEKESFLVVSYNQSADTLFMFSSTGETFSMSRELIIAPGIDVIG